MLNWDDSEFSRSRRTILFFSFLLLLLCTNQVEISKSSYEITKNITFRNVSNFSISTILAISIVFLLFKFWYQGLLHKNNFIDTEIYISLKNHFENISDSLKSLSATSNEAYSKLEMRDEERILVLTNFNEYIENLIKSDKADANNKFENVFRQIEEYFADRMRHFISANRSNDDPKSQYGIELINEISKPIEDFKQRYREFYMFALPIPIQHIDHGLLQIRDEIQQKLQVIESMNLEIEVFYNAIDRNLKQVNINQAAVQSVFNSDKTRILFLDREITICVAAFSFLFYLVELNEYMVNRFISW